jgi:chemotaxis protein MotB
VAQQDSRESGEKPAPPSLVVRRGRRGGDHDSHHGGAWKIAYADFVTAMMAFFLLMWLLGSTSKYDKQGIEDYFNTPLSVMLGGKEGMGAARPSVLQAGGRDLDSTLAGVGRKSQPQLVPAAAVRASNHSNDDSQHMEQLKARLIALIDQNPMLHAYKDQIRIAMTNEGLRIELVDSLKRPMFSSGSSMPADYAQAILFQIGAALNDIDNRVSIAGHTDAVPYQGGIAGYSNWELSSDRANAARRALVAGGLHEDKLLQVRGLADVLPLNRSVADEPTNRRISIVILNKAAEQAFFRDGGRMAADGAQAASDIFPALVSQTHPGVTAP